jgi:hypothetical protein
MSGGSRFQSLTVLGKRDIFLMSIRQDSIWNALLCIFLERRQGGISLFSLVISVNIFWAEIYWGRHFLGQNELKLSPLSKLGYAIFFQVKTTTHFIRSTPVKLFIGCFFFFVQLNNYISNLSLLKYFIQKIYGKRDISQQVVTLSKFGNARIFMSYDELCVTLRYRKYQTSLSRLDPNLTPKKISIVDTSNS